ncbi:MAG TPA: class I SAM-dependent methyltransferase [Gemmatimonadaceae bacterium]|nr:class I SAM-dependent methyltransferase [Gemmatimonadaceae bacterium]
MSQTLETPPVEREAEPWVARPEPAGPTREGQYVPFGNVETRNGLQARVEIPLMIRALRLPHHARILEIGCGRGVALPVLADHLDPVELVGLDIDPALLAEARARMQAEHVDVALTEGDVRDLPFASGWFDLVIDFGTCYHASDTMEGRRTALCEIARVLCDGGLFVHETRIAQRLAHPVRSLGRSLPWRAVPSLVPDRSAVLWGVRRKTTP